MRTASVMRFAAALTIGGVSLGGLTACDTTAEPYAGRRDPVNPYPRITTTGRLYELVAFTEPVVTPAGPDSPMHVVTPCRSTQDGITRIQYQYEWFDEAGRPLDAGGWKYEVIPARSQVFLEGNSLSSQARDWRLTVRPSG